MRTATRSALWAALPLLCLGMDSPQQRPEAAPAGQQSALPAGQPSTQTDATKPPVVIETDPARMAAPGTQSTTGISDKSYVIGAEDVLTIQVWGDARLSGQNLVRPDGRISMNLIGEVTAAGLTPAQLEKQISDLLRAKEILNKPQVTVQVTQINSKKYFILGEILKPGPNPLVVPTRVLEALVNAGGFKDFANTKKIEIVRGNLRFKFNYKDVIKGKHTEQNIWLEPGDIINVP
jgi:polysaccharide export outer membrane protein